MAKVMKLNLVEQMVNNYKTKQLQSIVNSTTHPMAFDAQSVWFDLENLKKMIGIIESETAKHPEYKMHDFGIRFYYSAYPDSENWNDPEHCDIVGLPANYQKLHTLIGIPTANIDGVNSDFDPLDVNTYNGSKPVGVGLSIMAENHGDLNPPGNASGLWF